MATHQSRSRGPRRSQSAGPRSSDATPSDPDDVTAGPLDPQGPENDASRRTRESSEQASDSGRVAEGRDDNDSPPGNESKDDAAAPGRHRAGPLKVKIEFVVVSGPAADELIKTQAAAVRDALQWFAENPPDEKSA
jgi:hypothetical protein